MEQIYTIPVNEAFEAAVSDPGAGCPVCALFHKLEEEHLDLILGASMMEPDIRIRTNREGFCATHFSKMLARRNRLSLALIMESHLASVADLLSDGIVGTPGDKPVRNLRELDSTCYLCGRIEESLSHMIETVVLLWQNEDGFRRLFAAQHRFCLPHYRRLLETGKLKLHKKIFPEYYRTASGIMKTYLEKLSGDVSWFCKKFDYRYEAEPWYDAKDSIERTVAFLTGDDITGKEGRKVK